MCCTQLAWNTGCKNDAKNRHLRTIAQFCRAVSSQLRHVSTIGKKLVKHQHVLHMSPQYGELQPTSGWDRLSSLWHPSKFQLVSHLAFVTAVTSLTGGQPNCAQCLTVSWAATLYIHFWGLLPLKDFCPVQNLLYGQILHSRILAALLHSTAAAGISQTLRCGTRNGIMELSRRAPPIFGRAAITLGIDPHSGFVLFLLYGRPME